MCPKMFQWDISFTDIEPTIKLGTLNSDNKNETEDKLRDNIGMMR
jgi:hypothetical protein